HLISEITGSEITTEILSKILILAGFCLLAAISSRAFIKSMTDRLLKEVSETKKLAEEAKQQAENTADYVNSNAEPDDTTSSLTKSVAKDGEVFKTELAETERKILKAMIEGNYSIRTINGISKDS